MLANIGTQLTATHFRGTRPIDAIWTTPDIEVTNICAMPIGYGVGDHRAFLLDVTSTSMVGHNPQPVKKPAARRLNTKIPHCSDRYNVKLEEQFTQHQIIKKLNEAHQLGGSSEQVQSRLDQVDRLTSQLMLHAERQCRKLKSGRIPFSPEAGIWIKRTLCYRALLRFWAGKVRNKGNLRRQARRCHILNPFALSIATLSDRLQECKARCKYFVKYGHKHRYRHLTNRLQVAKERQDTEAERRILQIMKGEKDRAFWRRLNWALGQRRGSSVSSVQVEGQDGQVVEYSTQAEVQAMIWEKIHQERYHLAEEAPICQGRLRGEFGYTADTIAGDAVLRGLYDPPLGIHEGTQLLFQSIAELRKVIPQNSVKQLITREDWQRSWRQKKETTSSSPSGLHFGHYISGADSDIISDVHALKNSIAFHHGVALSRWKSGLCVMLEKQAGVRLLSKLRAILLMEADFNAANKILFGNRMLNQVRRYHLMPEEIFSERQRMAEDGILAKVLFYDISRQLRAPAALASVDAANCYDRVAHAIASLIFRAVGAPPHMTQTMLTAIQQMKFFLRTSYGDSDKAVGSKIHLRTQGFMQGNGASPAGWTVVSLTILHAHKAQGHGASFVTPISGVSKDLSCILYVDDNDLIHICNEEHDTINTAYEALQRSVTSWGNLLIATGGSLKPPKCFYYLIGYKWDNKGEWSYIDPESTQPLSIEVPLPDGSTARIAQQDIQSTSVTLGGQTAPSGLHSLRGMADKALEWAHKARNSGLRPRDVHISVNRKFWPKLRYGLCANTSTYEELVSAMHKPYFWMAPLGGLIRSAKREIRYLDTGFYGLGFPHWGIESLIEAYKKFYIHYGTSSVLGVQMQVSVENFVVELGISHQPFTQSYKKYGDRVTDSFCSRLWEKLDRFNQKLILGTRILEPPRQHDQWLMSAFERAGYSMTECYQLNLVRLHQQVIFESDIFNADGNTINSRYFSPREVGIQWSSIRFGKQRPSNSAFNLWRAALSQLAPGGRRHQRLGEFLRPSHTIWKWRYDPTRDTLYLVDRRKTVRYRRQASQRQTRNTRYSPDGRSNRDTSTLPLCSVHVQPNNTVTFCSHTNTPRPLEAPSNFLHVLQSWPNSRIWKDIKVTEDGTWVYEAIREGTLICVSDGSYIKELHQNLCSTAIMMECTAGRGRLSISFIEKSLSANAFRGELLGLMTIHLILHSVCITQPTLTGAVKIYSDCMGALQTIAKLPSSHIPPRWKHADILKVISQHGKHISFRREFFHVKAHQDDNSDWTKLSRPSQLNCACDGAAKGQIYANCAADIPLFLLPMESLSIVGEYGKITSDTEEVLRFLTHKAEARELFLRQGILSGEQFDEIAWDVVHRTLRKLPKMFQLFAGKQVFGVSAVLGNLSKQKEFSHLGDRCPSCELCKETTDHILLCREEGRLKCLRRQLHLIEEWLHTIGTNSEFATLLLNFLHTRGEMHYSQYHEYDHHRYSNFFQSQSRVGWIRLMEGMVSAEILHLDKWDILSPSSKLSVEQWTEQFIQRLLEATHGVWIYRNLTMHDQIAGVIATKQKEQLLQEIEHQVEIGGEGLAEQDLWMAEVNFGDLSGSSGESESYWLLAIRTARETFRLQTSPP